MLGPGINIKRSPLCGRNFEYFSEDPVLAGVLGAALVEGIQSQGVGTSVKHFAANNQETDRLRVSADVDERTLREIYLPASSASSPQARPWTVMCAYNKVNGAYASQHRWLLTEVLRGEWGFDGLVVSDWGAVHDRVAALAAGLDLEMPPNLGVSDAAIVAAVRAGELDEACSTRRSRRVLELVDRAQPRAASAAHAGSTRTRTTRWPAPPAAECAVLLKNDDALLPLRPTAGDDDRRDRRVRAHPALPGRRQLPGQPDPGRRRPRRAARRGSGRRRGRRSPPASGSAPTTTTRSWPPRRSRWPAAADAVVVFLGLPAADESEGFDRDHIDLPANQTALLAPARRGQPAPGRRARQRLGGPACPTGSAHAGRCWSAGCPGRPPAAPSPTCCSAPPTRPAGSPRRFPLRLEDNPSYLNFPGEAGHVRYGEGVFVGYRGYDALDRDVSYPFGHGLSYTRFAYADLRRRDRPRRGGDLTVEVTCRSPTPATARQGGRAALRRRPAGLGRPARRASSRAFTKIDLDPGERTRP